VALCRVAVIDTETAIVIGTLQRDADGPPPDVQPGRTHVQMLDDGPMPALGARWTGSAFEDGPVPSLRVIPRGDFIGRITLAEHVAFETMAAGDITARVWWNRLLARDQVHLDSEELIAGLAFIKAQGVPGIWADAAAADARIAKIRE
jgi:hypothetical protein